MPGPRPKVRPTAGLHNLGRGPAKQNNQYVTTCKLCGSGIYMQQPHRWLRDPMGYSHTACIERAQREAPAPGPAAETSDDFGWPPDGHEPPTAAEWYEPEGAQP